MQARTFPNDVDRFGSIGARNCGINKVIFKRIAMDITQKEKFWRKLNSSPLSVYIRFQRLFARKNKGKYIRGLKISNGTVEFNLE